MEVNSRALLYNFRVAQKLVGKDVIVMAILKSNAYGHGITEVTKELLALRSFSEGGWFGVDSIDEALLLKKSGIKNPTLILGYIPKPRLAEAIKNSFRFALYDVDTLKECVRIAKNLKKKVLVHIKIETGTYRQGITQEEISAFARLLRKHAAHIYAEGIYTHFADTENTSSSYYKEQLRAFEKAVMYFEKLGITPRYRHAAASAATLTHPNTHFNMVRWGIGLYGLYPSEDVRNRVSNKLRLQPALTWKTRIAQIKVVPKGSTVGYDRAFTAVQEIKIAILPVGYWDGYDRRLSNTGSVLIRGTKCPVVGNVCMNMLMVDVTGVRRAQAGDEAVLLGRQGAVSISAEEIAAKIGTINYEVTTRVNPLIPRILR
ncbi:MAG: Alanine racemase [Parcubacteria group bacterium Gr01-1014_29]|nr:MAG: Alanine racemase [Parcubacteria group bacterium Gr01-1014_29]